MKVKLTRSWFAPNGSSYDKGTHSFPAAWEHSLPSTATVLDDEPEPAVVEEKPVSKK